MKEQAGGITDFEFDERWYLTTYPDIAKAVSEGVVASALVHYINFGRDEGRLPVAFDADWYARSYPIVSTEIRDPDPRALYRHFRNIGQFRGYRSHPGVQRLKNAAMIPSKFGGLWIDNTNASDLINGKYAIGTISREDASALTAYCKDGYIKLEAAVPPIIIDQAEEALEAAYSGRMTDVLFECHALSASHCPWTASVKNNPAKALDLHWWSEEIRNLIFCESATRFLHLIFERPALASQTLAFYRGSGQPLHQDSAYVPYSLPLQFTASWIALEDIETGAGELEYLVGSHTALPEYTYPGGFKSASEAERNGTDRFAIAEAVKDHERRISVEGEKRALKREKFLARRGDILFWHADLAHGGTPISLVRSRKSIVTHYCPNEVAPLYFENVRTNVRKHGICSYYSSGVYHD